MMFWGVEGRRSAGAVCKSQNSVDGGTGTEIPVK